MSIETATSFPARGPGPPSRPGSSGSSSAKNRSAAAWPCRRRPTPRTGGGGLRRASGSGSPCATRPRRSRSRTGPQAGRCRPARRRRARRSARRCASRFAPPADRGLVGLGREPGDHALDVASEPRAVAGERDALGPAPRGPGSRAAATGRAARAADPEVEVAPRRVVALVVVAMPGREVALWADQPPATQRHLDDDPVRLKPDGPDPHPLQPQKPRECRVTRIAVLPCSLLDLQTAGSLPGEGGGASPRQ